jgi:hypothetical protein
MKKLQKILENKNIFYLFICFNFLFLANSYSQVIRYTSFDDRPLCEESKGSWREFGNGCADECSSKLEEFPICTQAIVFACDCGKGKCWNDKKCIDIVDYKKIFDLDQEDDKKLIEQDKKKRQNDYKANVNKIMNRLVTDSFTNVSGVANPRNNNIEVYKELGIDINSIDNQVNQQQNSQNNQTITQAKQVGNSENTQPNNSQQNGQMTEQLQQLLPTQDNINAMVPPIYLQQEQKTIASQVATEQSVKQNSLAKNSLPKQ